MCWSFRANLQRWFDLMFPESLVGWHRRPRVWGVDLCPLPITVGNLQSCYFVPGTALCVSHIYAQLSQQLWEEGTTITSVLQMPFGGTERFTVLLKVA